MFEMFDPIGRYLLIVINWVNTNMIHSYALTVILFTVILKICTLPADIKQRKSTEKTAAIQPEIQKIQKRYEGNPEIAQKKVMEYQKKMGVSTFAGCLPMLFNLLFFIIFLAAMRFWANIETINLYLNPTIETLQTYQWAWIRNFWMPDSGFAHVTMGYQEFMRIPFDKLTMFFDSSILESLKVITEVEYVAQMAPLAAQYSSVMNGWFILPVLAGVSMLATQLLTTKLNPQPAVQQQQNPMMGKGMMYFMAAISVYFCITNNAAFALYWMTSNVCGLIVTFALNASKLRKKESSPKEAMAK